MSELSPVENILGRLDRVMHYNGAKGPYWIGRCPAHNDGRPSLHISERPDQSVGLYCYAQCETERVLEAIDLTLADLFAPRDRSAAVRLVAPSTSKAPLGRLVATYPYLNADETTACRQVRYADPKDFRLERPNGRGGWRSGLDGIQPPLYHLPELIAADASEIVLVVEGEKDVETAEAYGFVATTNAMGAGKLRGDYAETLAGRDVAIIPDNDNPGRDHAAKWAHLLAGNAKRVRSCSLPDLAVGGDLSDWFQAGHIAEELTELINQATDFDPQNSSIQTTCERMDELLALFTDAKAIADATPEEVDWAVEPFVADGAITDIYGQPKLGKSTLVAAMVSCVLDGKPFMGKQTRRGPVIYLTEQTPTTYRAILARARLLERTDLHVLCWSQSRGFTWPEIMQAAVAKYRAVDASMLVVDTVPQFAGLRGDSENDSGAALEVMGVLQDASAQGLAIVSMRHARKGGGEVAEGARGSSAIAGAVDIIIQMQRPEGAADPNHRVLKCLSRYDDTPEELMISWSPDEGYQALGAPGAFKKMRVEALLLESAPRSEETALSVDQIFQSLGVIEGVSRTSVDRALKELATFGKANRIGTGKKGNAFKYWVIVDEETLAMQDELAHSSIHSSVEVRMDEYPTAANGANGGSKTATRAPIPLIQTPTLIRMDESKRPEVAHDGRF